MSRSAYDVVVIGAGHNGLVAAERLARAGYATLVLEQRAEVGGAATNALAHTLPPLHPALARAIPLKGLEWIRPEIPLTAINAAGKVMPFFADHAKTASALAEFSQRDAQRWPAFVSQLTSAADVVGALLDKRPPDIDAPSFSDLLSLGGAARKFKALDRRTAFGLLRWGPMPVADFVDEWFDDELVQAAIAARGLFGTMLGPRSAGSTLTFLYQLAFDPHPLGSGLTLAGGVEAFSQALATAATAAGAELRVSSAVRRVNVGTDDAVVGVSLANGASVQCRAVLSAVGPKQTLLDLLDPGIVSPDTARQAQNIRARGITAKVNLSLDSMPVFPALAQLPEALHGRIHIGPTVDYLERAFDSAKYGASSAAPWLEIALPSAYDPSRAPAGRHVMSIYVQYAPRVLRDTSWQDERASLLANVMRVLDSVAPGLDRSVTNADVITPEDFEHVYGMDGGHVHHGEHSLDQMLVARPMLGMSDYQSPIRGLYLGSAGSHPGGGLTGLPGLLAAREVSAGLKQK